MAENKGPEVSGRAFLGHIKHLKTEGGDQRLKDVLGKAGAKVNAIFSERIRIMGWYPYEAYRDFLIAIDKTLGKGDLSFCRELGTTAGQRDMGTIYKIYCMMASAATLIGSCNKFWLSYYRSAGSMEAIQSAPEKTVLRISGFPTMHPAHCRLMEGWISATMASVGFEVLTIEETQCTSRGGSFHDFTFSWKKK